MFAPQYHGNNGGTWPRPFLAGFILLMLFLSLSTDISSTQRIDPQAAKDADNLDKVKEQIIYELSLTNEVLENDIKRLKQYVMDLRRTARACDCHLDNSILTLYPEFNRLGINETNNNGGHSSSSTTVASQRKNVERIDDDLILTDAEDSIHNVHTDSSSNKRVRQHDVNIERDDSDSGVERIHQRIGRRH